VANLAEPFKRKTAAEESNRIELSTPRKKLDIKVLQYPDDIGSPGQGHFIILKILAYVSGQVETTIGSMHQSYTARTLALKGSTKFTKTQISLYMPPQVEVSYKADYTDTEISARAAAGAGFIEAMVGGKGVGGKIEEGAKAVARGGTEVVTALGIASGDVLAPGASALGQIAMGKIQSSKMELLFRGVGRRQFNYTFTFIPKSSDESQSVDQIIFELKKAMLPTYAQNVAGLNSDRTLKIPTTFDIEYMYTDGGHARNNFLNKISTCYLTDLSVKYGGDRYKAYKPNETIRGESEADGKGAPPQRTEVSLTFNEIEIITQEAINKGF
jgi:hypothetical protein